MNFLTKLVTAFFGAAAIGFILAISVLLILKTIVDIFHLNHNRDVYWVLTVTTYVLYIGWIVGFGYLISILR